MTLIKNKVLQRSKCTQNLTKLIYFPGNCLSTIWDKKNTTCICEYLLSILVSGGLLYTYMNFKCIKQKKCLQDAAHKLKSKDLAAEILACTLLNICNKNSTSKIIIVFIRSKRWRGLYSCILFRLAKDHKPWLFTLTIPIRLNTNGHHYTSPHINYKTMDLQIN